MGVMDILKKIGGKQEEAIDIPDDMTKDKFLRSLRRQRRIQLEEVEKEHLQKQIADFNRKRTSENMFGNKKNNILIPNGKMFAPMKKEKYMFKNDKPKKKESMISGVYKL